MRFLHPRLDRSRWSPSPLRRASAEQLQWAVNVYLLAIAVLVVTAGRLGDMFGRKRVFLIGLLSFALGSTVSGGGRRRRRAEVALVALAAVGIASLALFWAVEHRVREPIVEFDLFRNGPTSAPAPPLSPWSAPTGR